PSLMLPRPHRTTLSPYTTLFRSRRVLAVGQVDLREQLVENHTQHPPFVRGQLDQFGVSVHTRAPNRSLPDQRDREVKGLAVIPTDRKSTRLNSSHVKISYAVFCL